MERLNRSHHPKLPNLLPFFSMDKDVVVLDMGCGLLPNTKFLFAKGYDVFSIDLNFEYLLTGKKNFPKANLICGDVRFLPFRMNKFDGIVIVDLIEHIRFVEVGRVLKEAINVSKKNSYIFLHVPLEGSFSYKFLRLIRKIWTKDPGHKHDFKYAEVKKIVEYLSVKIEKEWIAKRLKMLRNLNFSAVAVTFILGVKKMSEKINC